MDGVRIETATGEGIMASHLFGAGARTGVILYQDAFGPRRALYQMAARIAGWGYAVLVPDLFYRLGPYAFDAQTAFADAVTRAQLMGMMQATPQAQTMADGAVFLQVLAGAGGVTGGVATVGYCMGGARALNAAATYPDRIVAAASFHGGNLATDQPDSPHLRARSLKAQVYIGCAGVDGSFPPEQSAVLARALREAEVDHVLESYKGMAHGWTVPDSAAYDAAGSERHFRRLQVLLTEALPAT